MNIYTCRQTQLFSNYLNSTLPSSWQYVEFPPVEHHLISEIRTRVPLSASASATCSLGSNHSLLSLQSFTLKDPKLETEAKFFLFQHLSMHVAVYLGSTLRKTPLLHLSPLTRSYSELSLPCRAFKIMFVL